MYTVEQRDALRVDLLEAAYEAEDGVSRGWLQYDQWAAGKGIEPDELERASRWLVDHGLAKHPVNGPIIEISAAGRDAIENRRRIEPPGGTVLEVLTVADFRRLEQATGQVETLLADHGDELDPEDRDDLRAQLDTIEAQKRSPRPRKGVVGAALKVITFIVLAAATRADRGERRGAPAGPHRGLWLLVRASQQAADLRSRIGLHAGDHVRVEVEGDLYR